MRGESRTEWGGGLEGWRAPRFPSAPVGQLNRGKQWSASTGFPGSSVVKSSPAMQETWVRSLGQGDPLDEEMATHSNILAWRIPCTEEPGGLQSMGLQSQTGLKHLSMHALQLFKHFYSRTSLPSPPF